VSCLSEVRPAHFDEAQPEGETSGGADASPLREVSTSSPQSTLAAQIQLRKPRAPTTVDRPCCHFVERTTFRQEARRVECQKTHQKGKVAQYSSCVFFCTMLCISAACMPPYAVCPSVRLSVTFVYSVETSKHILKIFQHRVAPPFWILHTKRYGKIRRGPPNGGVECRWGRQKSRFSTNICLHRVLSTVRPPSVIHTASPDRVKLMTLVAGKRRRLLFTGDDSEVFMTRSLNLNVTPKTTKQRVTVRSDQSEAEVTSNERTADRGTVCYC